MTRLLENVTLVHDALIYSTTYYVQICYTLRRPFSFLTVLITDTASARSSNARFGQESARPGGPRRNILAASVPLSAAFSVQSRH